MVIVQELAELIHGINLLYTKTAGLPGTTVPWIAVSEGERAKFIAAVEEQIKNPSSSPENSHKRWMKSKKQDGWIFGEFNRVEKTHPCLANYDELPLEQQIKDKLFMKLIKMMKSLVREPEQWTPKSADSTTDNPVD